MARILIVCGVMSTLALSTNSASAGNLTLHAPTVTVHMPAPKVTVTGMTKNFNRGAISAAGLGPSGGIKTLHSESGSDQGTGAGATGGKTTHSSGCQSCGAGANRKEILINKTIDSSSPNLY